MFMTNIPRRKIYEEMLVYEDVMISMQILNYNKENFNKFESKFHKKDIPTLKEAYKNLKALIIMFLENKKFPLGEEFDVEFNKLLADEIKINLLIKNNKNIKEDVKKTLHLIDTKIMKINEIKSLEESRKVYETLDKFNSAIPKLLEIRRDHMKK